MYTPTINYYIGSIPLSCPVKPFNTYIQLYRNVGDTKSRGESDTVQ